MFTGIIRHLGTVSEIVDGPDGSRQLTLTVTWSQPVEAGDSVAVNGACLTVLDHTPLSLTFRLMPETLRKTNLGSLPKGAVVNLERPLRLGDRLDGHFVQGHIDGVVTVTDVTPEGQDSMVTFAADATLMMYLIPKGSVAIDGVSLTVVDRTTTTFRVSMMPYTLAHTTFQAVTAGYQANFEADMLGKHVVQLTQQYLASHDTPR